MVMLKFTRVLIIFADQNKNSNFEKVTFHCIKCDICAQLMGSG